MALSSSSKSGNMMASMTEGATKIDVMLEEQEMTVQQQIYEDLVHSVICGHITHRSRGSHMEIDGCGRKKLRQTSISILQMLILSIITRSSWLPVGVMEDSRSDYNITYAKVKY